jgi:hypothetical protein
MQLRDAAIDVIAFGQDHEHPDFVGVDTSRLIP